MTVLRIGIYGGTFDPPHAAHLALARLALLRLHLASVHWVLSNPWQKTGFSTASERLAMLRLALNGEEGQVIDTCEIDRGGPSYTWQTIRGFQKRFPGAELFLLIGGDQLANFLTWAQYEEIIASVSVAVFVRKDGPAVPEEVFRAFASQNKRPLIFREEIPGTSSTFIRSCVEKKIRLDDTILNPDVARYIYDKGLYAKEEHGQ